MADSITRIRGRIRSTEDRAEFGPYLLTLFRRTPSADIARIADALIARRYFGSALLILRSLRPTADVLSKVCRCQIGRSDFASARVTLARLIADGLPERQIEDLSLDLHEAASEWDRVADILRDRARGSTEEHAVILRYATASQNNGDHDAALEALLRLVRTVRGAQAVKQIAQVELTRMNPAVARSVLEAYVATGRPDRAICAQLGDCLSF